MIRTVLAWPENSVVGGVITVVVVVVLAALSTRLASAIVKRSIRAFARRGLKNENGGRYGGWQVRSQRIGEDQGGLSEQRRRHRINAAARMISHLVSVAIWIIAAIATFHLLDINPAFFLSSAGFIGAGLAIGGQHKVNDYLTGLSVHFEDRYGVGDRIVADIGSGEPFDGLVDRVGLFSTRLRDEDSTIHVPNHHIAVVRNLSQQANPVTVRVKTPDDDGDAAEILRDLAGTDGLTDVVVVGDVEVRDVATGEIEMDFAATQPLSERVLSRLEERFEKL
ncbi:MAG: hypothetical protein CSA55_04160 [Ilumatobacter coccineus]|uniref:MscS family transporter n=1 Tax=Ilumatobacter coccineus TaxID=467094 RepID=A0A2G6K8M1_9ACTN|nr:MAG: hypothetical protein CSA55_04160 [Ilumatobacter coccineus]